MLSRIEEVALIPVIRAPSPELALAAVEAIVDGGISIFEITLTVPGAVQVIERLVKRLGARAVIGAGTVLTPEQARACLDAGAEFVVSPGLDLPTLELVLKADIAGIPGALTPTEVITAWHAGADIVKIFPCSAMGGPPYLKSLKGPFPQVPLLPSGGVTTATAHEYLEAGAVALGIGSELVAADALSNGQLSVISERARELVSAVRRARSS